MGTDDRAKILTEARERPLKALREAEPWWREAGAALPPDDAVAFCIEIGRAADMAYESAVAVAWYERAREAADRGAEEAWVAAAGRQSADSLALLGRVDEVAGLCSWVDRRRKERPGALLDWLHDYVRGWFSYARGNVGEGIARFTAAAAGARAAGLGEEAAFAGIRIAHLHLWSGRHAEALTALEAAAADAGGSTDDFLRIEIAAIGVAAKLAAGRAEESLRDALDVLPYYRRRKADRALCSTAYILSFVVAAAPAYSHVVRILQSAYRTLARRSKPQPVAFACNALQLGWSFLTLGRPARARALFDTALRAVRGLGRWEIEVEARLGLGRSRRIVGDAAGARAHWEASRDLLRDVPLDAADVRSILELAALEVEEGRGAEARELLRWADRIARAATPAGTFPSHDAWGIEAMRGWANCKVAEATGGTSGAAAVEAAEGALAGHLLSDVGRESAAVATGLLPVFTGLAERMRKAGRDDDARPLVARALAAVEETSAWLRPAHRRTFLKRADVLRLSALARDLGASAERCPAANARMESIRPLLDEACRAFGIAPPSGETASPMRAARLSAERTAIETALHETGGNRARAAKKLGMTYDGLRLWLKRNGASFKDGPT